MLFLIPVPKMSLDYSSLSTSKRPSILLDELVRKTLERFGFGYSFINCINLFSLRYSKLYVARAPVNLIKLP